MNFSDEELQAINDAFRERFGTEPMFDFSRKDYGYKGAWSDFNYLLSYLPFKIKNSIEYKRRHNKYKEDGVETSGMLGPSPENVGRIVRIGDNKKKNKRKIDMTIPRGPAKIEHYIRYFEGEKESKVYEDNMQPADTGIYRIYVESPKYSSIEDKITVEASSDQDAIEKAYNEFRIKLRNPSELIKSDYYGGFNMNKERVPAYVCVDETTIGESPNPENDLRYRDEIVNLIKNDKLRGHPSGLYQFIVRSRPKKIDKRS